MIAIRIVDIIGSGRIMQPLAVAVREEVIGGVGGDIVAQIFMADLQTIINHGNLHTLTAITHGIGVGIIGIAIDNADIGKLTLAIGLPTITGNGQRRLTGVIQIPLVFKKRIINGGNGRVIRRLWCLCCRRRRAAASTAAAA